MDQVQPCQQQVASGCGTAPAAAGGPGGMFGCSGGPKVPPQRAQNGPGTE